MKLRTLTMVILVTASFGHTPTRAAAANLELAEAAFREGNHSEIVKRLLPSWKRGELTDPRGLYLLSRGCFFAKPSPLKGALAIFARSCHDQSGRITRAAAQAGSIDAMLDLTYTLHRPNPVLAHPDLRRDTLQAYGWALLADALAEPGEQKDRAGEAVRTLKQAIAESQGRERGQQLMQRAENEARGFLVRLAPSVRPDLVPGDTADAPTFAALGWVDVPGTAELSEMSEGPDSLYVPSLQRNAGRVRFHVSLSDVDLWRVARMEGDCATTRAWVLRDSGWQGYGESDAAPGTRLAAVDHVAWDTAPERSRLVVDFACRHVKSPTVGKPSTTGQSPG